MGTPTWNVERASKDSGLGVGEGDGGNGVREGVEGQNDGLRSVWK